MFTGIVVGTGRVESIRRTEGGAELRVRFGWDNRVKIGDSVCINGVCLTVTSLEGEICVFDVVEETLNRSNIGLLNVGDEVNVELALGVGERFGGHFVTGHVDGVGRIKQIKKQGTQWDMVVECNHKMLNEVVERGSLAVDGVSLTVAEVGEGWFRVALVPHTMKVTNLKKRRIGDIVNIETDVLAKYVAKFLQKGTQQKESLTERKLKEMGY